MKLNLNNITWKDFETHLVTEAKYSRHKGAMCATKSRFSILKNWFGKNELDWSRENFNKFIIDVLDRGNKESYCNKFIGLAKHLDKFLGANVIQDYSYYTEEQSFEYEILTPNEIMNLATVYINYRKECGYLNKRNKILILIYGLIGARPEELIKIKWTDVKFDGLTYYILFRDTKTKQQRKCPIGNEFGKMIQELPHLNEEYVFATFRGNRLGTHEVNNDIKRRAEAIGLKKKVWTKLLRHSAITNMLLQKMEGYNVSRMVGHSNPKTTMRYLHQDVDSLYIELSSHPFLESERTLETDRQIALDFTNKSYMNRKTEVQMNDNGEIIIKISAKESDKSIPKANLTLKAGERENERK